MALRPTKRHQKPSIIAKNRLINRTLVKSLLIASLAGSLGGCGTFAKTVYQYLNPGNSFLDPSQVGRFDRDNPFGDVRPVKWPILEQLDVVDEPVDRWASATDPTPADIVSDNKEYQVGPGDVLRIDVYELVDAGRDYVKDSAPVNEAGTVTLQNLGNIKVAGLTTTQIEQKIGQLAIERNLLLPKGNGSPGPQVSVTLAQSASRQFNILGSVVGPGYYPIIGGDVRLLTALAYARDIAGGSQPGLDYLYVIRQNSPKYTGTVEEQPLPASDFTTPAPSPNGTSTPPGNPLDALDSLDKSTTQPQPAPTPPATPTPGATGPIFVRPLATADVTASGIPYTTLAQADLDAAISGTAPAASAPTTQPQVAATVPADDLLNQAMGATSKPGQNVYIDGKWVTLPATNPAATQETGIAAAPTTAPSGSTIAEGPMVPPASQPDAFAAAEQQSNQRVIRIPINALREGNPRYNIVIRPGDTIVVPGIENGFFYMMGHVSRPGVFQINGQKITLKMAVAAAGNLDAVAIPRRCDLIRRIGPNQEVTVQVNLQAVFDGTQPDIFLKPNDVVNVGTDFIAPFLAVTRNAYRASYGFGFIYDRNYYIQPTRTQ